MSLRMKRDSAPLVWGMFSKCLPCLLALAAVTYVSLLAPGRTSLVKKYPPRARCTVKSPVHCSIYFYEPVKRRAFTLLQWASRTQSAKDNWDHMSFFFWWGGGWFTSSQDYRSFHREGSGVEALRKSRGVCSSTGEKSGAGSYASLSGLASPKHKKKHSVLFSFSVGCRPVSAMLHGTVETVNCRSWTFQQCNGRISCLIAHPRRTLFMYIWRAVRSSRHQWLNLSLCLKFCYGSYHSYSRAPGCILPCMIQTCYVMDNRVRVHMKQSLDAEPRRGPDLTDTFRIWMTVIPPGSRGSVGFIKRICGSVFCRDSSMREVGIVISWDCIWIACQFQDISHVMSTMSLELLFFRLVLAHVFRVSVFVIWTGSFLQSKYYGNYAPKENV